MRWLPSTWFFATRLADARKGTDQDDTGNLSSVDQRGIKTGTLKSAPKKNNIVLIIITFSVLIIMKSSYYQNIKSYIYIYIIVHDYMICMCYNVVELHLVNGWIRPTQRPTIGPTEFHYMDVTSLGIHKMLALPYRSVSERMRLAILQNNKNTEKKVVFPKSWKLAYSYHSLTTSMNIYHIKH